MNYLSRLLVTFSISMISLIADAQKPQQITWQTLQQVSFREVFMEEYGVYYDFPTFTDRIKQLEGKEVKITGYVLPVDVATNYYVLSAFPYSNCFFCGNAGPESVMDLQLKDDKASYKNDERLTFKGTLRLNSSDIYQLTYILENAEEEE